MCGTFLNHLLPPPDTMIRELLSTQKEAYDLNSSLSALTWEFGHLEFGHFNPPHVCFHPLHGALFLKSESLIKIL